MPSGKRRKQRNDILNTWNGWPFYRNNRGDDELKTRNAMKDSNRRPVLIVIAGPNGSGKTSITSRILNHEWLDDADATLLFRLVNGIVVKRYVQEIPRWASNLYFE